MDNSGLVLGGAARPRAGERVNGDCWAVHYHEQRVRLMVVDGLGHGPAAAQAAATAVSAAEARPELGPAEALRLCHQALKGTRGAAISFAQIEPRGRRLHYAGVGNVEARIWSAGTQQRPIAHRGIVGAVLPTVRCFEYALGLDWLLLLHTDGVSARFDVGDLGLPLGAEPGALAEALLRRWGRQQDDATVVVIRSLPFQAAGGSG